MRKTLIYLLMIILAFSGLELFARHYDKSLPSISDKTLLKKEMFLLRRPTDVLFLGSSRTQDAIDPTVMMRSLNSQANSKHDSVINIFNGAAAKATSEKLKQVVGEVVKQPGLKLLVLELSGYHTFNSVSSSTEPKVQSPQNTEQQLHSWLRKNLFFVKHRKSFRIEILRRVPFLLLANMSDGTSFFQRSLLTDMMEKVDLERISTAIQSELWNPKIVVPKQLTGQKKALTPVDIKALSTYKHVSDLARDQGVNVVFVVQPINSELLAKECSPRFKAMAEAVASVTNRTVLTQDCQRLNSIFFRNSSHLNKNGRTLWSSVLAPFVADALKL